MSDPARAHAVEPGSPMIEYVSVYKAFDVPVLSGVDLTVNAGEMMAIFGPSGTGKSVLMKTTIGLITPDSGDVRVAGRSIYSGKDPEALEATRRLVGYVFQNAALFDSQNVHGNVRMGIPEDVLAREDQRTTDRRIWGALELVNLDPRQVLPKLPSELSGGMRKRVGIARAIVARPQILLWDEPTTGLDPVNSAAVERIITGLSRELEVTSIVVTHDIEGGLLICDRVAMLTNGKLRFTGSPEEFRASEDPIIRAFVSRAAAQDALAAHAVESTI